MDYLNFLLIINILVNFLTVCALRNAAFQDEPENMTVIIGETFILKCKFTLVAPVCHWRKNDKFFMPDGERQHFNMKPEGNCAVHITFAKMVDTGWYQCGYPQWALWSKPAYLDVIESEQDAVTIDVSGSGDFIKTSESTYEITKNQNVNLTCENRRYERSASYGWKIWYYGPYLESYTQEPILPLNITSNIRVKCGYADENTSVKTWSRELTLEAVYATSEVNTSFRAMTDNLVLLNCFADGFPRPGITWQILEADENEWKTISTIPKCIVNASNGYTYYRCLAANKFNDNHITNAIVVPKLNKGITEIEICLIIGFSVMSVLVAVPAIICIIGAYKRRQLCCFKVSKAKEEMPTLKISNEWERACSDLYQLEDRIRFISIGNGKMMSFEKTWPVPHSPHLKETS